jgi:hypothetical protein
MIAYHLPTVRKGTAGMDQQDFASGHIVPREEEIAVSPPSRRWQRT